MVYLISFRSYLYRTSWVVFDLQRVNVSKKKGIHEMYIIYIIGEIYIIGVRKSLINEQHAYIDKDHFGSHLSLVIFC